MASTPFFFYYFTIFSFYFQSFSRILIFPANASLFASLKDKHLQITKATPVYSISSFEAMVGSTLSDLKLPDNFSWDTDKIDDGSNYEIQSGNNTLYVKYTPDDTDHYEVVNGIEIIVEGVSNISVFVELYYSSDGINPIMDNTYGNATDGFKAVYNGKAHYVIPVIKDSRGNVISLGEFDISYGYNGNFTQSVNPGISDVNTVEFEILIQLTSASQSYSLNCSYSNCEKYDDGDLYISSSLLVQPFIIDPNDLVINLTHDRELIYDGMKHEPTVEVLYNGSSIDKKLYSVTYANNINASSISYGYAQVVIRGTDSYCFGTDNYKIVEFSIAKANVTVKEWPVVLHPTKDESVLQEGDTGRLSDTGYASVPGTFDFTLPAGTTSAKFTAGTATTRNATVSLTFTPTDSRNYNSVNSTASFTLEAVCYIGNTYYGTIEAALNSATSGQTVFVIEGANPTIRSSVEIKSGVILCIPYSGTTYNGRQTGKESDGSWKEDSRNLEGGSSDFADSNATRVAKYRKTYVNIADSVELTVNGTLQIGGILGVETQVLNGATSGYYSEIILGNDSKITSNGYIYCLGYIKEASSNNGSIVEAKSGTIYMPFAIHDYRGGRATIGAYYGSGSLIGIQKNTPNITPFNVFSMPNIQSLLIINYGANLVGYADLYTDAVSVGITIPAQHNTTDANIIGSENSIINLTTSNSRIEIKYNAADCRYTNKSLDRTTLNIYGGAKTGTLSLSVTVAIISATVTTDETFFPIPWIYDINLHDGDYVIENKMKFLTGSSLTIHEDANLSLNADTIFYSSFTDVTYGGSVYPQKDAAYITNNGTLNISAPFGGTIKTTCDTAVLNINNISDITSIEGHGGGSGSDVTFTQTSSITESINGPMVNDADFEVATYFSNGSAWYKAEGYGQYTIIIHANTEGDSGGSFGGAETKTYNYAIKDGESASITSIAASIPTKEYYEFSKWVTESGSKLEDGITVTEGNTTHLYATYIPLKYTIQYTVSDKDGNLILDFNNPSTEEFIITDTNITIGTPTYNAMYFSGWYRNQDGTEPIEYGTYSATELYNALNGDLVLYGVFTDEVYYSVKLNASILGNPIISNIKANSVIDLENYSSQMKSNDNIVSEPQYFLGWFTKDGTNGDWGDEFISGGTPVTGNITLYPRYNNKYIVTFLKVNGETYESYYIYPNSVSDTPSLDNAYEFVLSSDGSNLTIYTYTDWNYDNSAITSNITITPTYTSVIYYKVILQAEKGSVSVSVTNGSISASSTNYDIRTSYTYSNANSRAEEVIYITANSTITASFTYNESRYNGYKISYNNGSEQVVKEDESSSGKPNNPSSFVMSAYPYTIMMSSGNRNGGCILEDSEILMDDGSIKLAKDIKYGDKVMTWSFAEGKFVSREIFFIERIKNSLTSVITLYFNDGTSIDLAYGQSYFDIDAREYFSLNAHNVKDHLGKRIMSYNNGSISSKTIIGYNVELKYVDTYEFITEYDYSFIYDNVLTMEPFLLYMLPFEINDVFRYDENKMLEDIKQYGTYSYEEWADYVTEEQFKQFNGSYIKVAIEKGYYTIDYLIEIILRYVNSNNIASENISIK